MSTEQNNNAFLAHGSLLATSWTILFPLGAILIRVFPGSKAWLVHGGLMLFALAVLTSGVGVGVWAALAGGVKIGQEGHTVLGLVIFALAWTQPISGLFHHTTYKRIDRRTLVSIMHVALGRLLITAGMINGGLGIWLGMGSTRAQNIAYGTVAGIIWVSYIFTSFYWEEKRERVLRNATVRQTPEVSSGDSEVAKSA